MQLKGSRDTLRQPDHRLQRALNGDREALGHFFASQTPQLYRVALRILGKPQDAEEALQDGFLSAVRYLGKSECRSRFSAAIPTGWKMSIPDQLGSLICKAGKL